MNKTIYAFLILTIQGCVTHYNIPPNTPQALLEISTNTKALGVRVQVYENDKCKNDRHGNRLAYFFWDMGDPQSGVVKNIDATREFIYTFAMAAGGVGSTPGLSASFSTSCSITTGFLPKQGEKYKTHFEVNGVECNVSLIHIRKIENGTEVYENEKSARQITPACVNNLTD